MRQRSSERQGLMVGSRGSFEISRVRNFLAIFILPLALMACGNAAQSALSQPQTYAAAAKTTTGSATAQNFYIAQTQAGTGDGSSCTNAQPVSWFNTAGNWANPKLAGLIGPGDTVHLCGVISTPLTVEKSGSSGSPITILFEPNAKLSAPTWTGNSIAGSYPNAVIAGTDVSYITVDGGSNGIIEATNNGDNLTYQNTVVGVGFGHYSSDNPDVGIEIKNLTIQNLYVRNQNSSSTIDPWGILLEASDSSAHNNNINWVGEGVMCIFTPTGGQNVSVYSNVIKDMNDGIVFGSADSSSVFTGTVNIYNNDISDAYPWDDPTDNFHHEGFHFYDYGPGLAANLLKVHGNYVHGNWGSHYTALFFFEGSVLGGYSIYNNILNSSFRSIYTKITSSGNDAYIYNNDFAGTGPYMDSSTGSVADFANNIIYGTAGQLYNGNTGTNPTVTLEYNLNANPLYVNPTGGDYHLQSGSPAIFEGENLSTYFTTDKDNNPRPSTGNWDDGAYDYGTSSTTTYTVTPSAGSGGSISPATPQTVSSNATTSFTVTPATGYSISSVTGCGGSLSGNTYTTGPITANCAVTASFSSTSTGGSTGGTTTTYTVTPSAGSGGSISPSTPQTVDNNATTSFTVTPATGYSISSITGCGGTLSGNTYTTGPVTANCTVTAAFALNTYTVTPSAGSGGSISPSTPQTVSNDAATSFTVTPATGYSISSVTGCGGSLSGNTYTTGPITADCTVTASFSSTSTGGSTGGTTTTYTVTPSAGSGGSISPATPQTVSSNAATSFTVTPATGYSISSATGCGGSLSGNIYTTGPITADCTVTASFSSTSTGSTSTSADVPTLVSPLNGQATSTSVTFQWTKPSNANPASYNVLYSQNSDLSSSVVVSDPVMKVVAANAGFGLALLPFGFILPMGLALGEKKKRLVLIAILIFAVMSFASCGGAGTAASSSPTATNYSASHNQSYTVSGLPSKTTYYWAVQALDSKGQVISQSTTGYFQTQ